MDMFQFNSKVFVVALLFFIAVSVATEPSKIRSYKILEGDNLLVICNVTESPDIDVYWTKNDTKSQFTVQGKRLEMVNIKRSYSGDYICHALNTSYPPPDYNETEVNRTVQVINVDVQYPAEIDFFSAEPYELMENQTFTVTCDFQANPDPVWSIRNRDNGISMVSATLPARASMTSPKARCEYMGYWECTGSNILNNGVNVTRGHNITIFCSPRPTYQQNQYMVQASVGNSTKLKMYAQAYPKPIYKWYKDDGKDISNITKQNDSEDGSTLTFQTMSIPYFGNYTLKMQNKYGTYFAHYQIVADGKPERPTNLRFSDVTYDSVKLQWTSGFDMGSRQHFTVMKQYGNQLIQMSDWVYDHSTNHGINQNWTHILNGLISDTDYNLTVVSINERGFNSPFAVPFVFFRTKHYPNDEEKSSKSHVKLILGLTLGTIATLGVLAFIVYILKYRSFRTSYKNIKGMQG